MATETEGGPRTAARPQKGGVSAWLSVLAVILAVIALLLSWVRPGPAGVAGSPGAPGLDGTDGANGIACWDLNGNGAGDPATEDMNGDGTVGIDDCTGAQGLPGVGLDRPGFLRTTLDATGEMGWFTSITIGSDGLGLISYYDETNGDLKVAHCKDVACSSAVTYVLDSAGRVGLYTSVIVGTDGYGLISYYDETNGDLKVAHCKDVACSIADTFALDTAGDVGLFTSIAFGEDWGLISYYDVTKRDLKVAHCKNPSCSIADLFTLDSAGDVGVDPSITIGVDGLALISYWDFTNGALKVAHCENFYCDSVMNPPTISTWEVLGPGNPRFTSIAIGSDGLGLISYYDFVNGDLKVLHCRGVKCDGMPTISTLDSAGDVGAYSSLTVGVDGFGIISYYDRTNKALKTAHCATQFCTSTSGAATSRVDPFTPGQDSGIFTSITIGVDGYPLISYYDRTSGDLRVVHLSNVFGIPWVRYR